MYNYQKIIDNGKKIEKRKAAKNTYNFNLSIIKCDTVIVVTDNNEKLIGFGTPFETGYTELVIRDIENRPFHINVNDIINKKYKIIAQSEGRLIYNNIKKNYYISPQDSLIILTMNINYGAIKNYHHVTAIKNNRYVTYKIKHCCKDRVICATSTEHDMTVKFDRIKNGGILVFENNTEKYLIRMTNGIIEEYKLKIVKEVKEDNLCLLKRIAKSEI